MADVETLRKSTNHTAETSDDSNTGAIDRYAVGSSTGALALASLEAICLAVIAVGRVGIVLGLTSTLAVAGASFWHRDAVRIPILAISLLAAVVNLYAVIRKWSLRNAPSAAWRKKPFTRPERWRIGFVLTSSLLTLVLVAGEVIAHRALGH